MTHSSLSNLLKLFLLSVSIMLCNPAAAFYAEPRGQLNKAGYQQGHGYGESQRYNIRQRAQRHHARQQVRKYYRGRTLYYENGRQRAMIREAEANNDNDWDANFYDDDENMATIGNTFVFDPKRLTWRAYNSNGRLVRSGRASGGKGYCPDVRRACRTPVGSFRLYSKRGAGCKSSKYPIGRGGAPMPYCMFFRGGYAIHGSPHVPRYNASHGCIRVPPADARWLSRNFMRIGTRVIVKPYR